MRAHREDQIILACAAFGLLLALVAFLKVVLSPLVAAFAAGLGIGGVGVFALTQRAHKQARSD